MTREEFKKELDAKSYKWREEGEWIIVEGGGDVDLESMKSIPDNVEFRNIGNVRLYFLKSIPSNVKFNNSGDVHLNYIKLIPSNVKFNNSGNVHLNSIKLIPSNIRFKNKGFVYLPLLSIPINLEAEEIFQNENDVNINSKWLNLNMNKFPDSRWKSVDTGKVQMYESWIKNNY